MVRHPSSLDLIRLPLLMAKSSGRPEIGIGLVDGPVAAKHPGLEESNVRSVPPGQAGYAQGDSAACRHGTFVAGILSAKRTSVAPAICPQCTLLVRPIFSETKPCEGTLPTAEPEELARAILDCVNAGARIVNLSVALGHASAHEERAIEAALNEAVRRGVVVIAAAGNKGTIGGSAITRHPGTVPVVAYDAQARPMNQSNLGASIGRRGLGGPGDKVVSLGPNGRAATFGGTSAAAPFISGAVALLWSLYPRATASGIRAAIAQAAGTRRSVVPPLFDAWKAYEAMTTA